MAESKSSLRLFDKVDPSRMTRSVPPLVFHPTPDGYIELETPEEIRAWEQEIRSRLNIKISGDLGITRETCSAGCSDDCG